MNNKEKQNLVTEDLFFNSVVSVFKTTQSLTNLLNLDQGMNKLWSSSLSVDINKDLLEHSQAHSFTYYP